MRLGPVRTGPDDRVEAVAFGAEPADLEVERETEVVLGGRSAAGRRPRSACVGDRGGRLDAGHLAVVLHDAQFLDDALGGDQLGGRAKVGPGHDAAAPT